MAKSKKTTVERVEALRRAEDEWAEQQKARAESIRRQAELLDRSACALADAMAPLCGVPVRGKLVAVEINGMASDRKSVFLYLADPKDQAPLLAPRTPVISFAVYVNGETESSWFMYGSQKVSPAEALDYALQEIERLVA